MTPDPHIAFAAVHISLDASLRIAKLLTSRPVDTELMAEVMRVAHEADVKIRALLPGPHLHGVATAQPDVGVLHDLRRRLLSEDIDALVVVNEDPGGDAVARVLDTYFTEGAVPVRPLQRRVYPHGSTVRVITSQSLDAHPDMIAGSILDVAVVLTPISAAALDEIHARLLRNRGTLIGFGAEPPEWAHPSRVRLADFSAFPLTPLPEVSEVVGAGAEDVTITASPTYPDVFADLDEHLALVRAGIAAVETGPADEDGWPVQHTELCRSRGALTIAESWWCRCSGELAEYHSPGGRVDVPNGQGVGLDEPLDPSLWAQVLDRAQVAALAGERPSLVVQTEPREAGWLRDLVEPAPPSEAERIAAHVAAALAWPAGKRVRP